MKKIELRTGTGFKTGAASGEVHLTNVRDMQNIGVRIVKTVDIAGLLENQ